MTKPCSDDLRERVVAAMQSGGSCRCAAARFGVAPSSVVKWTKRAARTGSVNPAQMGGYRRPLQGPHRVGLLDQVKDSEAACSRNPSGAMIWMSSEATAAPSTKAGTPPK